MLRPLHAPAPGEIAPAVCAHEDNPWGSMVYRWTDCRRFLVLRHPRAYNGPWRITSADPQWEHWLSVQQLAGEYPRQRDALAALAARLEHLGLLAAPTP